MGMSEFNSDDHYIYYRRRQWHPTPVLLPGKSCGRRSLVGCGPGGREEWDTTERLHFHFSLSCIGEGNDNLWAAVYGVAQSWTRLKRLNIILKSYIKLVPRRALVLG